MDEKKENTSLDDRLDHVAQAAQAAYHVSAAVRAGSSAAGAAAGTAMAGPLGMLVGALAGSKTIWKGIAAFFLLPLLWLFLIVNMIGIVFSYLGFAKQIPMQTKPSQVSLQISKAGSNRFCKKKSMKRQSYR